MSRVWDAETAVKQMKDFVDDHAGAVEFLAAVVDWFEALGDEDVSKFLGSGDTRTKEQLIEARRVFSLVKTKLTDLVGPQNKKRFDYARSVRTKYGG